MQCAVLGCQTVGLVTVKQRDWPMEPTSNFPSNNTFTRQHVAFY